MTNEIEILLFFIVVGLLWALVLFVGAIILRAAVSLSSKLAGIEHSENPIPEPSAGKGMGILFLSSIAQVASGFSLGFLIAGTSLVVNLTKIQAIIVTQLASLPVCFLVMSGMLAALLPTSFARGMLVALCHILIALAIAAFFVACIYIIFYYAK